MQHSAILQSTRSDLARLLSKTFFIPLPTLAEPALASHLLTVVGSNRDLPACFAVYEVTFKRPEATKQLTST